MSDVYALAADDAATVKITADASEFEKELNQSIMDMNSWATSVTKSMEKAEAATAKQTASMADRIQGSMKRIQGGVDKVTSAFGLTLGAGMAAAVTLVGKAIIDAAFNMSELERNLKSMDKAAERAMDTLNRTMEARAKWLDVKASPRDNLPAIDAEIARLKTQLALENATAKGFEDQLKEAEKIFGRRVSDTNAKELSNWIVGQHADALKLISGQMDGAEKRANALFKQVQDIEQRRAEILNPNRDPAAVKRTNDLVAALEKERDTWHMTADQVQVYEQKLLGASREQIEAIEEAQKLANEGRQFKTYKEIENSLRDQAAMWAMNADQIEIYQAKLKGLTKEQLGWIEAKQKERDALITTQLGVRLLGQLTGLGKMPDVPKSALPAGVSAALAGSREAANAIAAAGFSGADPQLQAAQRQEAAQREAVRKLEELNKKTDKLDGVQRSIDRMADMLERIEAA